MERGKNVIKMSIVNILSAVMQILIKTLVLGDIDFYDVNQSAAQKSRL